MFEDGQVYSPVTEHRDGTVQVHLADNHPGRDDPDYLARRGQIAAAALTWDRAVGEPVPTIGYTEDEHEVWRTVSAALAEAHARHAHPEYLAAKAALGLPADRVPQLAEVSERLAPLTGWTYIAAPGSVPLREFYGDLRQRTFSSTQYLRHASQPLYTPEPDIIHEVIGHGNGLASERFARITEAAGQALTRMESEEAAKLVADVFWFSMEFGVIYEAGPSGARELKAYGAGILSSFGEMEEFREMEIRDLDLADMGTLNYDITQYQPILFAAQDLGHLEDVVGDFFATADDDACARLRREAEDRGLVPERV
ncbi:phenylalanine 4-monooxygenase [Janibacter alkaliphilus]|uniref:Phenylalanine-4-hydroxylase n=1 Tax=Janibacter alkaliphilus TaxID=1069963 RepID=A0A852WZG5_9MICO|nr:phenylalanine 4-monooxygenase [Janibacter alkaliphilus]NYG35999.1 phenylalanine-4-hydroxylase [Janibacter alkaliphilus]